MKKSYRLGIGLVFLVLASLACGGLTQSPTTEAVAATTSPAATNARSTDADAPTSAVAATPTEPGQTATEAAPDATATPHPTIEPTATTAPLRLEIVQTQIWDDPLGNTRANVLLHNPYDFPVEPWQDTADILNSAGAVLRSGDLYYLDGISGGGGYIMPGETVAANVCFTCEEALLTEAWASAQFGRSVQKADVPWEISTDVEPTVTDVSFEGDNEIFYFTGSVKNNSATSLQRISVRVIVYDQDGQLVGAAEGAAYDVAAGATGEVSSYGLGRAPDGPITYEVTALGVNY